MKKIFAIISILTTYLAVNAQGFGVANQIQATEKVVGYNQIAAVVEDTTITHEQLLLEMAPFMEKLQMSSRNRAEFNKQFEQLAREMLQNMVDRVIIVKEFRDKGMMIPQSKLDEFFENDIKSKFNGDRSEFLKYLQSQNKTIKQYRKEQEEAVILMAMRNQQNITASGVSPSQIIDYYQENKQQWYSPESVKISQIVIRGANPEDAKQKALKIEEEIKSGMDFAAAAKQYSQDERAKNGGDWGWYKKGQLNPLLDIVAFSLEIGKISEPVIISDFAYLLRVDEKKKEGIQPLDDVRENIEAKIADENAQIEHQKWLKRLREKAYIRYY